jgi:hypothetical protein
MCSVTDPDTCPDHPHTVSSILLLTDWESENPQIDEPEVKDKIHVV